jgi:hypothetical protein
MCFFLRIFAFAPHRAAGWKILEGLDREKSGDTSASLSRGRKLEIPGPRCTP